MTDEEFECLLQRLPTDNLGNIKYLDFMAGFESMSQNASILDDNKTLMTKFTKKYNGYQELGGKSPSPRTVRSTEQLSKMIKDLLKNNFDEVDLAFSELDTMNTRRLSMETMYQLLKRLNIQPSVSRDEISELWKHMIPNQDKTVSFLEFTRHFGFSPKSACYLNAKVSPPVKGDGDFLVRSRKLNSDTEIIENKLRAKVALSLDDLWTHFQELDTNNSGFVSKEDFRDVLTELCPELNNYQFEMIANKFHHEENQISYAAFLQPFEDQRAAFQCSNSKTMLESQQRDIAMYSSTMQKGLNAVTSKLRNKMGGDWKTLLKACKKLDVNNTGYLLVPEFRAILKLCNVILDENEVYHIMGHFDKDMVGKLDYSKFIEETIKKNK
ncbi:EF-hand calcium-binding domain-containing protein 6-like [Protopterus annectens]|uniref:EF-hand calcium-binding domain-containing protein 6-like n=1 Tax=Protopterus annectens TaxID=7888 RepID=UPI001CFC10E0|nr:EF-hand calcium-binding domain-containing protein 6-like [Protopterus annectens]